MHRTRYLPAMITLALAALACRFVAPGLQSATPTAQPEAHAAPASTSTTAPQASQPCAVPQGEVPSLPVEDPLRLPAAIQDFLNAAGRIEALQDRLVEAGLTPPGETGLALGDFNGDGWLDLALALVDGDAESALPPGSLLVFLCLESRYALRYVTPEDPDLGAPAIQAARDLTGDGLPDVVFNRSRCGAHTCFAELTVLVWDRDEPRDAFQGPTDDLPSPIIQVLGPDEPGRPGEIVITATGFGSLGAGPFRPISRRWKWDPEAGAFTVDETKTLSSNYRIHALLDADQAFRDGDYAAALEGYRRVIEDDGLDDWVAGQEGRANLSAYASFRIMLLHLVRQDFDAAAQVYGSLQARYAPDVPGSGFAEMARAFWTEYQSSGDLQQACAQARVYARSHSDTVLDNLYYGYANPAYSPEDLCSLGSQ